MNSISNDSFWGILQGNYNEFEDEWCNSLHLLFICLPYALFPVQSNSRYLLLFVKQSSIMDRNTET